jgi:ABC-2 type transport system ATP-binding protein
MAILDVRNITKKFGEFTAVDRVSFSVEPGRIFGILGPNGAGKTTSIRMMNYITIPDEGEITIKGVPVGRETQPMIGYMPEERGLYKKMKVGEHLIYLAQLKGMNTADAKKALRYWLERFEAIDWIKKEVGELSKGMQQKIQFIATIVHDPDLYIFDEPFSGLDPINSELLKQVILELKSNGKTIIFSTHRMEQVEQMCDDIVLYNEGRTILQGKVQEIKQSFGKRTVILEFDGDAGFLDDLKGVHFNNRSNRFVEFTPDDESMIRPILEKAMASVDVHRFERVYPSLHEIFIESVKNDRNHVSR